MSTTSDAMREQARRLYVYQRVSAENVAVRFGRSSSTIKRWVKAGGWTKQREDAPQLSGPTPPSRQRPRSMPLQTAAELTLHQRCCRLFDLFLSTLEDRMTSDDPNAEPMSERDVRALAGFSRAIEKIKEIEPGHEHAQRGANQSGSADRSLAAEEDELRREIVDRLLKLRERKRAERERAQRGIAGDTEPA